VKPRSLGRRLALQYLFMADVNGFSGVETPEAFFLGQLQAERERDDVEEPRPDLDPGRRREAEGFARSLILKVEECLESIDREISQAADNWTVSRIAPIERNIIRLAAAELRLGDSPRRVVLDEAVKLAKRFGDKDSSSFVNGVADRLSGGA
jgi:N utilization substance protein B